jgi:hypothetical protein
MPLKKDSSKKEGNINRMIGNNTINFDLRSSISSRPEVNPITSEITI